MGVISHIEDVKPGAEGYVMIAMTVEIGMDMMGWIRLIEYEEKRGGLASDCLDSKKALPLTESERT
jgi:hypothetical protein